MDSKAAGRPETEYENEFRPAPEDYQPGQIDTVLRRHQDLTHTDAYLINEPSDQQPPCIPFDGCAPLQSPVPCTNEHVDWSPLADQTGTRQAVNRYSITRYSTDEWAQNNQNMFSSCTKVVGQSVRTEQESKNTVSKTFTTTDRVQNACTGRLMTRAREIDKWKVLLERAIEAIVEEITEMEGQRSRLKRSMCVLRLPESIVKECIEIRATRSETELIKDIPEDQLCKEARLIADIKSVFASTLAQIEAQQLASREARQQLEFDWSDKKEALAIETVNVGLNNASSTTMMRPGATRLPNEQSTEEYYQSFSKKNCENSEICRQKSIKLRSTLNTILMNASRDLRIQADAVEQALSHRIACMEETRSRLEADLEACLRRLAETEKTIDLLAQAILDMDKPARCVQTRLDNRNQRPHVDNCRDRVHVGLIDEVGSIQDGVSAMRARLNEAEAVKQELMNNRYSLEREIMFKRRSIMLDKERCMTVRSHFPSVNSLSGFA